jgi:hypothetical protein
MVNPELDCIFYLPVNDLCASGRSRMALRHSLRRRTWRICQGHRKTPAKSFLLYITKYMDSNDPVQRISLKKIPPGNPKAGQENPASKPTLSICSKEFPPACTFAGWKRCALPAYAHAEIAVANPGAHSDEADQQHSAAVAQGSYKKVSAGRIAPPGHEPVLQRSHHRHTSVATAASPASQQNKSPRRRRKIFPIWHDSSYNEDEGGASTRETNGADRTKTGRHGARGGAQAGCDRARRIAGQG